MGGMRARQRPGYNRPVGLRLALVASLALAACSAGPAGPKPQPILSKTLPPQEALASIVQRFSRSANAVERAALKPEIESLLKFHPGDDAAKLARILHAWLALERGDLREADQDLLQVERAAPDERGAHRDLAQALRGALLRRQKRSKEALEKLRPLYGKLLDGYARAFLNEEAILAALEAKEIDEALRFMTAWLQHPDGPKGELQKRLARLIADLRPADLDAWLARELEGRLPGEEDKDDMLRIVLDRVAELVLAAKDVARARTLLASAYDLLGSHAEPIAKLALGASVTKVDSRAVGLLLSLDGDAGRERSIQLAAGLAWGLGIPGGPVRVVTADDGGRIENTEDALSSLVADGATILVAGVSRGHATRASLFARFEQTPLVLLRPADPVLGDSPWVFQLGEDPVELARWAAEQLATRGTKSVGALLEKGYPVKAGPPFAASAVCGAGLPAAKIEALVVIAPAACARAVGGLAGAALSPEVAGLGGAFVIEAGAFKKGARSALVDAWVKRKGASPSWWAALGRDAGVLAAAAVQGLPVTTTEDAQRVKLLHGSARDALAKARATELWTTEAKGFEGAQRVARTFDLRKR